MYIIQSGVLGVVGVICLGVFCYYTPNKRRKDKTVSLILLDYLLVVVAIIMSMLLYQLCSYGIVRGVLTDSIYWGVLSAVIGGAVLYIGYTLAERERRKG